MDPFLVSRRSGRTIAMVVGLGFGGGTMLLGVTSAAAGALNAAAILPALWGYFVASIPFFAFGAILAACRRELWVVPEQQALKMLTFRQMEKATAAVPCMASSSTRITKATVWPTMP